MRNKVVTTISIATAADLIEKAHRTEIIEISGMIATQLFSDGDDVVLIQAGGDKVLRID